MFIDSKRECTVGRAVKVEDSYQTIFSDHYTCILTLENLPYIHEKKTENTSVWNLAKEGGWDSYKELTEKYADSVEKAIHTENTIEEKMKKFNDIHEKIKFKAFGKTTIKSKPKEVKKSNVKKDVKDDEAEAVYQEEVKRTENEIKEIKKLKTSRVGRIWEIKKRIVGGKKASLEATAIVNPHTGKLVVSKPNTK